MIKKNYTVLFTVLSGFWMPCLNVSCVGEGPPTRAPEKARPATAPLIARPTTYIQTGSSGTGCSYGAIPSNTTYIQPGYTFSNRKWLMKGDGLTPSDKWLAVEFTPPSSVPFPPSWWNCLRAFLKTPTGLQYLWTSGISQTADQQHEQFSTVFNVNASTLPVGPQQIWFAANDQDTTFWSINVNVTAPVYAVVSVDWDEPALSLGSAAPPSVASYGACSTVPKDASADVVTDPLDILLCSMGQLRHTHASNNLGSSPCSPLPSTASRPGFAYSHFVGPYVWGLPSMVPDGAQQAPSPYMGAASKLNYSYGIENWLKQRPADEVGVHIHAWKSSFTDNVPRPACCGTPATCASGTQCACPSGATCPPPSCCATASCAPETTCAPTQSVTARLDVPSQWSATMADGSGYWTMLRSYSSDELTAMFDYSSQILVSRGFRQPTSFRAGGWTSSSSMLTALAGAHFYNLSSTGVVQQVAGQRAYLVDSSSAFSGPVCDFFGHTGQNLCTSLTDAAGLSSTVTQTSQPYFVSGASPLLEVPDNGVLADYVTTGQMSGYLTDNNGTGFSASSAVLQIGFHPHTLLCSSNVTGVTNISSIEGALEAMDTHLYANDSGPIVYTTISRLVSANVWPTH